MPFPRIGLLSMPKMRTGFFLWNGGSNYFLRPEIKGALGFFCSQKYQILGKGIVFCMLIGKMKLKKVSQIWRAPKKMKFILKSKQIKLDLPTFCYFWLKKSLLTLFKILISQKLLYIELLNKFILIRNELL